MDYFETQDKQLGQALTINEFVKVFNAISQKYNAQHVGGGCLSIHEIDTRHEVASLYDDEQLWTFVNQGSFTWQELRLMSMVAANMPEFRGEVNDD